MKDLRIVVVSWNVEKLLARCLKSLPAACAGLEWDCIVVDNASEDGSVAMVRKMAEKDGRFSVIANFENVGFSKACNQGTEGYDARYVLYLNPDTECPKDSLARLVKSADETPKAGILGPKLIYPDGRHQESIRRFPSVWSQAGILLKLHHLFPGLKMFRSYFAKDLDATKEQTVDQVMGACFLVRRKFLEETKGFDERYFIWFEEVDWCRTARERGWEVRYVPGVSIIHHGGESFGQVFSAKKQGYYNTSLISYFQKWHPAWQAGVLRCLAPIAFVEAWMLDLLRKPGAAWVFLVILLELVSRWTIFRPIPNSIATFVLGIAVLLLAWKRPVAALGILLMELLIGSKGQLLQFGDWPVTTSLRIVLTGAFLIGWFMGVVQQKRVKGVFSLAWKYKTYLFLFAMIVFAFVRGKLLGNADWLKDGNAWLDWALFIPVLDVVRLNRERVRRELIPVFLVGIFWLALKTLGLEYIFSHGFKSISPNLYLWVRRTGVGEVTLVIGNAFRIFMQSYVYATAAWILAAAYWFSDASSVAVSSGRRVWWMMTAATFILALSLSRSFWIGTVVGALVLAVLFFREHVPWWKRFWGPVSAGIVGLLLVGGVLAFPVPQVKLASLVDLFGSRTDLGEAAAVSRWHLLTVLEQKIEEHPILGSGFGATVTYQTADPRILKDSPTGAYTTYSFEWGWLEHWVKFGLLGIPLMLWLLVSLGWRIWKSEEAFWFRAGAVASLVALAVLHVFTPYLNHPLGFLYFFVGEAILLTSRSPRRVSA